MNIVLIGMPACGKSSVGVILAKTLGFDFIDTDLVIQQKYGLLQEIIDKKGLEYFRCAEEDAVLSVCCMRAVYRGQTVVATGGSVVYSDAAMKKLRENGVCVYLKLPCDELIARLDNIKTRGIAKASGETFEQLYAERSPLYEKYADITVAPLGLSTEQTIEKIIESLNTRRARK